MPLSEHEQQLLAQLEKQLHDDDPRFASTMHTEAVRGRGSMRNVVLGVVIAVVGLGVLLAVGERVARFSPFLTTSTRPTVPLPRLRQSSTGTAYQHFSPCCVLLLPTSQPARQNEPLSLS